MCHGVPFVAANRTCYFCEDYGDGYSECQNFNSTAPTKTCDSGVDFCLTVFTSEFSDTTNQIERGSNHDCDSDLGLLDEVRFCQMNGEGCHKINYNDEEVSDIYICCCNTDL